MKISISAESSKFADKIKSAGYCGVDYSFTTEKGSLYDFSCESELRSMRDYANFKELGLKICQTHLSYCPGSYPLLEDGSYDCYEKYMLPVFIRQIELTAQMDCDVTNIHLFHEPQRRKCRESNIKLISKLLPYLEKNKVRLSIENLYGLGYGDMFLSTAEDLLYYADYFNSPYIGVCVDSGHALIRGQNPIEMIKKVSDKLFAVHLHTTVPNMDLHAVPYFSSYAERICWENLYKALCEVGYKGTFNMELFMPEEISEKSAEYFYKFSYDVVENIIKRAEL